MKKTILSVISLLILVCLLVACSGTNAATSVPRVTKSIPSGGGFGAHTVEQDGTTPLLEGEDASEEPAPVVDTSEHLNMIMYAVNDPAQGEEDKAPVMALLNEILKEKINVTLTWNNIATADRDARYPLIIASNEKFDLIYTANWVNYTEHARAGAFVALDDLFQYVPGLRDTVPEHFWNGMKSEDGKYYAMPSTWQYPRGNNLGYREDLRKKYGTPEIKSIETMTQYFDAIVENSPAGFFPMPLGLNGTTFGLYANYHDQLDNASIGKGNNNIFMGKLSTPEDGFSCYYYDEDFEDWVVLMKEWLDKGYWSRSVLSNTTATNNAVQAGTGASWLGHYDSMRWSAHAALRQPQAKDEGWEFWVWRNDEMLPGGKASWINSLQDCVSIPRQAQDPVRSMLLIEILNINQEANDLIQRGIEGVNWTADEQGRSYLAEGQVSFGINAWHFRNAATYRDSVFEWPQYEEYDKLHRSNTIASPSEGFRFKKGADFQNFMSEVETIVAEYHLQMLTGMAEDPLAMLEQARQRLKDAGVDDYLAAVNAEWDAYWAEYSANN